MDDLQAVTRALVDNGFRYATTEVCAGIGDWR